MTGSVKRKVLILLGAVMFVTMMIAASLPNLELKPGMPLPRLESNQVVIMPTEDEPMQAMAINKFFLVFLALILVVTLLFVLYKSIRGFDWKSIAGFLRAIVVISLVIVGVGYLILLLPRSEIDTPIELPIPTSEPPVTSPLGPVPPSLLWVVGIGMLALSFMVGIWVVQSSRQAKPITLIGLEAEKAWQALKTGLDLKEVIIQCYRQMGLVLAKEQGIERKEFMTTGEFEGLLESAGMPHDPIHQLTQLFEAVRYGDWQPNPVEEQKAHQCLEAIMLYSREHGKD
jgi:hypothetical protein